MVRGLAFGLSACACQVLLMRLCDALGSRIDVTSSAWFRFGIGVGRWIVLITACVPNVHC